MNLKPALNRHGREKKQSQTLKLQLKTRTQQNKVQKYNIYVMVLIPANPICLNIVLYKFKLLTR